jgi:murein L,D-transpeptidase YcbB/YkuD
MRLTRGLAGISVLVLPLLLANPPAAAERNSPPGVSSSGSIFEYFERKRQERRLRLRELKEPGPRIENAPSIDKENAEAPLVYRPEKLVSLNTDSFAENGPLAPLPAAIENELLDKDATLRVIPDEKTAIIDLYRNEGFKPLWTSPNGLNQRGREVLKLLSKSAEEGLEPSDYLPPALGAYSDGPEVFKGDMIHLARLDLGLTAMALKYARHASGGRLIPNRLTRYNDITPEAVSPSQAIKVLAWCACSTEYLKSLHPKHPAYQLFKAELARKRALARGSSDAPIPVGNRVNPGESDERLPLVRLHLERLGYFRPTRPSSPSRHDIDLQQLDPDLSDALKDFQKDAQLKPTGALDQATLGALNDRTEARSIAKLIYNIERLRWLPKELGSKYVIVNQAAYQLRIIEGDKEIWRTKVIIGKPLTQTVAFHDRMEMVVFNPSWGVPPSIIRNEMLPILRRDPSYLDRLGYRVIAKDGQIVRSSSVEWSAYSKGVPFSIQQPPSDDNALGEIKFLFPNDHSIYMHDTPARELFARPARAFSHGCVRVENPRVFAETLLGVTEAEVAKRIDSGRSQSAKVKGDVKVHITYFTAWPDAHGKIVYYDDIYGRDQRMGLALSAMAVATR